MDVLNGIDVSIGLGALKGIGVLDGIDVPDAIVMLTTGLDGLAVGWHADVHTMPLPQSCKEATAQQPADNIIICHTKA
jgi:hypothetical protein